MRTETLKIYEFNELSEKAKKIAIEDCRLSDGYLSWDWEECITDEWEEQLAQEGFPEAIIYFTGFGSQGDGACFTCPLVDIPTFCKRHMYKEDIQPILDNLEELDLVISIDHNNGSRYYHENSTSINIDHALEISDKEREAVDMLEHAINSVGQSLSRKIYFALRDYYYELLSDEVIADHLAANDFEFTEDGKIF